MQATTAATPGFDLFQIQVLCKSITVSIVQSHALKHSFYFLLSTVNGALKNVVPKQKYGETRKRVKLHEQLRAHTGNPLDRRDV